MVNILTLLEQGLGKCNVKGYYSNSVPWTYRSKRTSINFNKWKQKKGRCMHDTRKWKKEIKKNREVLSTKRKFICQPFHWGTDTTTLFKITIFSPPLSLSSSHRSNHNDRPTVHIHPPHKVSRDLLLPLPVSPLKI